MIDIGSLNVNGSYKSIFDPERFDYTGVDMEPGEGVDLVLQTPYQLPFEDASMELVISGQMLEHNKFFWLSFEEIFRILRPGGLCFMIAPSRGEIHRYPLDCYRFYPDAYVAMAEHTDSILIDCWLDTDGTWGDLTGVFFKPDGTDVVPFDTSSLDTIGGPSVQFMEAAYRAEIYLKQRDKARQALERREAEVADLKKELIRLEASLIKN
ncbi:MAG: class I SAM-dependent methyltransferase [Pseudomonadota bacterium]